MARVTNINKQTVASESQYGLEKGAEYHLVDVERYRTRGESKIYTDKESLMRKASTDILSSATPTIYEGASLLEE